MTKTEASNSRERLIKYETLEKELFLVEDALQQIEKLDPLVARKQIFNIGVAFAADGRDGILVPGCGLTDWQIRHAIEPLIVERKQNLLKKMADL